MLRPSGPWHEEQTCTVPATVESVLATCGPAPPHAARLSATSPNAAGVEAIRRRPLASISPSNAAASPACASKCKPSIRKDCVVVPGVATGAVVIGNCAVELVVMHVLQSELYIEPRPEVRAAIIEWDVVELQGPTVGVGTVD